MGVSAAWMQWPSLGHTSGGMQEVVGEANYQSALDEVCGGRCSEGVIVRVVTAELVREPKNRYDRNAVAVDIEGRRVGYLPRDDAPRWHAAVDHLGKHGYAATCRAELLGGWDRGGRDKGHIGVVLWADKRPRDGSDPFLPGGDRVSVVGEERHQEVLVEMQAAPAQVVELRPTDGRLEVAWDGRRVGELTDAMTARYLPLVSSVLAATLPASCRARVSAGAKKLELHVDVVNPATLRREADLADAVASSAEWSAPLPPAAWLADPLGRHEARWWDGAKWTEHVADGGQAGIDPPT